MANLSGHGVRSVLPTLLGQLKEKQWRVKHGSCELLSSMVNCAPRQLALSLPRLVPALAETAAGDSHPEVRKAAIQALKKIATVITSPEIRSLEGVLVDALVEPSDSTLSAALSGILSTSFVHTVDGPSLAFVCPIVSRAFRERSAEMKRRAAHIIASMLQLMKDPKEFAPYYSSLLPHLQNVVVDPIPEVRQASAKALGCIGKCIGEDDMKDMMTWLFQHLEVAGSNVERSGAANAIAEILQAFGPDKLKAVIPVLVENASSSSSSSTTGASAVSPERREGYMGLFIFLPHAFGDTFATYVPEVLPCCLAGLGDENEAVRDVSLRAAGALVQRFGASHSALLIQSLEEGLFSTDWRVRVGAASLLGDLINTILHQQQQLDHSREVLNRERRAFLLSALYIARADENLQVRLTATQVWKNLVSNTPKTLKELLPILLKRLLQNLGTQNHEKQISASRCIGELVEKLGPKLLEDLLPRMESSLKTNQHQTQELSSSSSSSSSSTHIHRGVGWGLSAVVDALSKDSILPHREVIERLLRQLLQSDDPRVRQPGIKTLATLAGKEVAEITSASLYPWMLNTIILPPLYDMSDSSLIPPDASSPSSSGVATSFTGRFNLLSAFEELLTYETANMLPCCIPVMFSPTSTSPVDIMKIRLITGLSRLPNTSTIINVFHKILHAYEEAILQAHTVQSQQEQRQQHQTTSPSMNIMEEVRASSSKIFLRLCALGLSPDAKKTLADQISKNFLQAKPLIDFSASSHGKLLQQQQQHQVEDDATNPIRRVVALEVVKKFFNAAAQAKSDVKDVTGGFLQMIIPSALCDPDPRVRETAGEALAAILACITKELFIPFIEKMTLGVRRCILNPLTSKEEKQLILPGFSAKTTNDTFQAAYQQCLLYGSTTERSTAAEGFGDMINHMNSDLMKTSAVKIAGPSIRVLGDRTPSMVKLRLLRNLRCLLSRSQGGPLKAFTPQLQSSFLKSLNDQSDPTVRRQSALALRQLVGCLPTTVKVDVVVKELLVEVGKTPPAMIPEGALVLDFLYALHLVLRQCLLLQQQQEQPQQQFYTAMTKENLENALLPYLRLSGGGSEASVCAKDYAATCLVTIIVTDSSSSSSSTSPEFEKWMNENIFSPIVGKWASGEEVVAHLDVPSLLLEKTLAMKDNCTRRLLFGKRASQQPTDVKTASSLTTSTLALPSTRVEKQIQETLSYLLSPISSSSSTSSSFDMYRKRILRCLRQYSKYFAKRGGTQQPSSPEDVTSSNENRKDPTTTTTTITTMSSSTSYFPSLIPLSALHNLCDLVQTKKLPLTATESLPALKALKRFWKFQIMKSNKMMMMTSESKKDDANGVGNGDTERRFADDMCEDPSSRELLSVSLPVVVVALQQSLHPALKLTAEGILRLILYHLGCHSYSSSHKPNGKNYDDDADADDSATPSFLVEKGSVRLGSMNASELSRNGYAANTARDVGGGGIEGVVGRGVDDAQKNFLVEYGKRVILRQLRDADAAADGEAEEAMLSDSATDNDDDVDDEAEEKGYAERRGAAAGSGAGRSRGGGR